MDAILATAATFSVAVVVFLIIIWAWRVVNWAWLRPKKLEKSLRRQGLNGNPYRLLRGDMFDLVKFTRKEQPKSIALSDDILPHILPFYHDIVKKYGKKSFIWFGPTPMLQINEPGLIKEMMTNHYVFQKVHSNMFGDTLAGGLLQYEEDKWAKHRKIVGQAFQLDKLKNMVPAICLCCKDMVEKWEKLTSGSGSCEVDVWPYLEELSGDVISRTAFGTSYEEGNRIFKLQKEQIQLVLQLFQLPQIPGWRLLPTKAIRRMNYTCREIQNVLMGIIKKRENKRMEMGGRSSSRSSDDLLGILLDSNLREIQENGNKKDSGMSMQEVMEECKLFYIAGTETTSNLLVWTLVLLSQHQVWQHKARQEVFNVLGNKEPDFEGLNRLKTMTAILYEVLRLYPPAAMIHRSVPKTAKLGNMTLPAGTQFTLPIAGVHHDKEIWGEDVEEFKPERFADGISGATKNQVSFVPFGWGPRICVAQNFAMIEVKTAIATLLKNFSFELSTSYTHAPFPIVTLQPQHGAHLIVTKI